MGSSIDNAGKVPTYNDVANGPAVTMRLGEGDYGMDGVLRSFRSSLESAPKGYLPCQVPGLQNEGDFYRFVFSLGRDEWFRQNALVICGDLDGGSIIGVGLKKDMRDWQGALGVERFGQSPRVYDVPTYHAAVFINLYGVEAFLKPSDKCARDTGTDGDVDNCDVSAVSDAVVAAMPDEVLLMLGEKGLPN